MSDHPENCLELKFCPQCAREYWGLSLQSTPPSLRTKGRVHMSDRRLTLEEMLETMEAQVGELSPHQREIIEGAWRSVYGDD